MFISRETLELNNKYTVKLSIDHHGICVFVDHQVMCGITWKEFIKAMRDEKKITKSKKILQRRIIGVAAQLSNIFKDV